MLNTVRFTATPHHRLQNLIQGRRNVRAPFQLCRYGTGLNIHKAELSQYLTQFRSGHKILPRITGDKLLALFADHRLYTVVDIQGRQGIIHALQIGVLRGAAVFIKAVKQRGPGTGRHFPGGLCEGLHHGQQQDEEPAAGGPGQGH